VEEAYAALSRCHKSLLRRVKTSGPVPEFLPLKDVDFGVDFEQKLLAFTRSRGKILFY